MNPDLLKPIYYYLLYTYPGQKHVHVMHTGEDKVLVAEHRNKGILSDMGDKLKADNLIGSYQLVPTTDKPFK